MKRAVLFNKNSELKRAKEQQTYRGKKNPEKQLAAKNSNGLLSKKSPIVLATRFVATKTPSPSLQWFCSCMYVD